MAAYGYSHVPDRGFHAFLGDLEEGAWKEISIDKYDAGSGSAAALEAPRPVAWKLRARWSIARLDVVLAVASDDVLRSLDAAWDSAQRAFDYTVAAAEEHEDAPRAHGRDAGPARHAEGWRHRADHPDLWCRGRFRALAAGSGQEQAHGGRSQEDRRSLTSSGSRRRPTRWRRRWVAARWRGRPGARSMRLREAMGVCVTAFNSIHDEMVWLLEHLPAGKKREQIEALHRPFLELLKRYPPPASAASAATRAGRGGAEIRRGLGRQRRREAPRFLAAAESRSPVGSQALRAGRDRACSTRKRVATGLAAPASGSRPGLQHPRAGRDRACRAEGGSRGRLRHLARLRGVIGSRPCPVASPPSKSSARSRRATRPVLRQLGVDLDDPADAELFISGVRAAEASIAEQER